MHPLYITLCKASISFLLAPQQHGTAMADRIGAAKVQGLGKGDLIDHRFANLLCIRRSQGQLCSNHRLTVTPLSCVLFPPGGKCH